MILQVLAPPTHHLLVPRLAGFRGLLPRRKTRRNKRPLFLGDRNRVTAPRASPWNSACLTGCTRGPCVLSRDLQWHHRDHHLSSAQRAATRMFCVTLVPVAPWPHARRWCSKLRTPKHETVGRPQSTIRGVDWVINYRGTASHREKLAPQRTGPPGGMLALRVVIRAPRLRPDAALHGTPAT